MANFTFSQKVHWHDVTLHFTYHVQVAKSVGKGYGQGRYVRFV